MTLPLADPMHPAHPLQVKARQVMAEQMRQGGIPVNLKNSYPDDLLITNLVAHGQPLWSANTVRHNPQTRFYALAFYLDCEDADKGDKAARERVDYCVSQWQAMRKEELLSDDPDRMYTDLVNPAELI